MTIRAKSTDFRPPTQLRWRFVHHRHKQPDCHRQTKKGPREPLILRPELRSSDPTHAGGHSPKKGAGGCGSLGLSPRRALRGYPIGLGSDTGRPWPEPQLETLNSRWWAVCTEWKAGVPVQEARSPQQLSPRGDWPAFTWRGGCRHCSTRPARSALIATA